ncbi:COG4315 family predicted lipoprotein [Bacillus rhizoplanae]|uniref:COG4315 family predicted lipoprotein n=1 Tax=Bacillus rhizoplanae TaxID=2880966 RepID=UPI003D1A7DFB
MKAWQCVVSILASIFLLTACNSDKEEGAQSKKTSGENVSEVSSNKDESSSLQLLENDKVGKYLADANGKTLYYFTKDTSKVSNCSGDCVKLWPPFAAKDFEVPKGFDKKDFATITREDTKEQQVTYKGYPLYYFANDKSKGDINGQGVKDIWFVLNSETTFKQ